MTYPHPRLRTDLSFDRRDDGERAVTFVKDPIREVIYEWSDLQLTIAELLNGKRSLQAVSDALAEAHQLTVPLAKLQRFVAGLEQSFLLAVTHYESVPPRMERTLQRLMRQLPASARDPNAVPGATSEVAALLDTASRHLAGARYPAAARAFAAALELQPEHPRARAAYAAIHTAFFLQHRQRPSYMRMIHLWNPDRFLGWLDARVGKLLFSTWGLSLFAVCVLSGVALIPDIRPPALRSIDWAHVLLAPFVVGISTLFLHELAHGLACKHYGGKVESMGIMLFYGVMPGAYCDVTETQLFRERSHRVVVYMAGVLFEIPVLCLWLWCYHLCSESFVLHNAIVVWVTYDIYMVTRNVVPLVKGYDGYYALTHHLDIPDLSERAFAHLRALAAQHVFGVPAVTQRTTAREGRIFVWFGLASSVYYLSFLYGIWFRFLFPLVLSYLHTPGLVLALAYAYRVVGKRAVAGLSAFVRFLVRERRRIFSPRRSLAFATCLASVGALLAAPYHSWVDGEFVMRPHRMTAVRATEPGLVADVLVREGQHVRRGDIIARLDDSELDYRERELDEQISAQRSRLSSLEHGPRSVELAVSDTAAARTRLLSQLARGTAQNTLQLFELGVVSRARRDQAASAAESAAGAQEVAERARLLARAQTRTEVLDEARAQLAGLEAQRHDVCTRRSRMVLTSPTPGVVVGARLEERVHSYLASGDLLAEVHDLGRVYGEVSFPRTALLTLLAAGNEVSLRAAGDPGRLLHARIVRVQPRVDAHGEAVSASSVELPNPGWPSGVSGHARVYFASRSIAFNWFGAPLLQLIDFSLWSLT